MADAEWERYRAELQALYLDMTADQVRVYMVENYNFSKLFVIFFGIIPRAC